MNNDWVFLLKFSKDLPDYFFDLSDCFSKVGLTLIPIDTEELTQFISSDSRMHLICLTRNMRDAKNFSERVKPIITHGIRNGVVSLYHLSSYNFLNISLSSTRLKNYHFAQLPTSMPSLASAVLKYKQLESQSLLRWPGGRRGSVQAVG